MAATCGCEIEVEAIRVAMVKRWAPSLDVPWRPKPSRLQRAVHALIWIPGCVFVAVGAILDQVLAPLARRSHHSSAYRVLARKV